MRCCSALPRGLCLLLGIVFSVSASAHKSSDAYLQIDAGPGRLELRWDIALRDLDAAIDLDSDVDGRLTWGEVRTAWPRIESYALRRLAIDGCALAPVGRGLERRNDGTYAVLRLAAPCTLPAAPVIAYSLFADVDPTHRGIAKIQRPGAGVQLTVLEPRAAGANAAGAESMAGSASATSLGTGRATDSATDSATGRATERAPDNGTGTTAGGRWAFLGEGVHHILGGYDHVLFLLCLLLPSVMRRTPAGWRPVERLSEAVWPVVGIVSAFTVAHSITLGLAALKLVSLPSSFIEPAIAVTIALAALDNLRPVFPVRRVVVTFFFGLIHGFGFASVLGELELPRAAFAWALLQFNLGLELGQIGIVAVVATLLFSARRWRGYARWVIGGGSLVAIVVATVWFIERTADVSILPL